MIRGSARRTARVNPARRARQPGAPRASTRRTARVNPVRRARRPGAPKARRSCARAAGLAPLGPMRALLRTSVALAVLAAVAGCGCGGRRGGEPAPPAARVAELDEILRLEDARDSGSGRLKTLLGHDAARVRARAALALGRIGDPASAAPLREALRDEDPAVRRDAALALGLLGDEEAEPVLLRRLALDRGVAERAADLAALGRVGGERSLPALTFSLTEPEAEVRAAAALALAALGHRRRLGVQLATAEAALATALGDGQGEVRRAAAFALHRVRPERGLRPPTGDAAVAALRKALRDTDPEVRSLALRGFAQRGPQDHEPLVAALADSDWRVRVQAVRVLPATGGVGVDAVAAFAASSFQHLAAEEKRLLGPELHAVLAALEALQQHPTRPKVIAAAEAVQAAAAPAPAAAPLAARARALAHCAAAAVLERAGRPVLQQCGTPTEPPPWRRKVLLAAALADARPAAARLVGAATTAADRARRLEELFRDPDPRVRAAVAESAGTLDDPRAARLLRDALKSDDPGVIAAAAEAVRRGVEERQRRDPSVVPRLVELLGRLRSADNPEALVSVIDALKAFADPQAVPALTPLLADPNVTVRDHARGALRWLHGRDPELPPPAHPQPSPGDPWALAGRDVRAVITTERGDLTLRLFPDDAPRAVASFVQLARRGFYDGLAFHRVVPDFVAQGGDPRGDGYGGPGYSLRCEINAHRFGRGAVGIALAGKDTGGSQFFVTHSSQPQLDGRYTVVGQLEGGLEVLDALQAGDRMLKVRVDVRDRPAAAGPGAGRALAGAAAAR
jgi:cyclophilin family peptidyl-prolyl cis-trans isomerase/HEAT repeat protein